VIPDSAWSLLAILFLVSPGLAWEMLRERRLPGRSESVFRELTRIALASIAANVGAALILILVRVSDPAHMVDIGAWLRQGDSYLDANYRLIAGVGIAQWLLAMALTLIAFQLRGPSTGPPTYIDSTVWHELVREDRGPNQLAWLQVGVTTGERFFGYYAAAERDEDGRHTIGLQGPNLMARPPAADNGSQPPAAALDKWDRVYIPADKVSFVLISYQPRGA